MRPVWQIFARWAVGQSRSFITRGRALEAALALIDSYIDLLSTSDISAGNVTIARAECRRHLFPSRAAIARKRSGEKFSELKI